MANKRIIFALGCIALAGCYPSATEQANLEAENAAESVTNTEQAAPTDTGGSPPAPASQPAPQPVGAPPPAAPPSPPPGESQEPPPAQEHEYIQRDPPG